MKLPNLKFIINYFFHFFGINTVLKKGFGFIKKGYKESIARVLSIPLSECLNMVMPGVHRFLKWNLLIGFLTFLSGFIIGGLDSYFGPKFLGSIFFMFGLFSPLFEDSNMCYCLNENSVEEVTSSTESQSEGQGSETPSEPEKETKSPFWKRKRFWAAVCGSTLILGLFLYFGFGGDSMGMLILADHLPYLYRSSEYLYDPSVRALRIVMRQVDFNSNPIDPDRQVAFEMIGSYTWNGVAAAIGATISTFGVNVDVYGLSDKDFMALIKYIATLYRDVDTTRIIPRDVGKSIDDWVRALPKD